MTPAITTNCLMEVSLDTETGLVRSDQPCHAESGRIDLWRADAESRGPLGVGLFRPNINAHDLLVAPQIQAAAYQHRRLPRRGEHGGAIQLLEVVRRCANDDEIAVHHRDPQLSVRRDEV